MNEHQIITVPILPFGMVHCHLVIGAKGCVLVDTGIPGSEAKIERVLKQHGRTLSDITLIVVTHAHTDHAGSAARLRELTGAPIMAHAADLDYYERRKEMTYCVAHWWGPLFLRSGVPGEPYTAFTPDILLQDNARFDLSGFGIAGSARHTPGHTAGSVSVELEGGDALVGDLIASGVFLGGMMRTGRAIRPPFEDDPQTVSAELMGMVDAGMQRFHMGHGGPLGAEEVSRHALALRGEKPGRKYMLQTGGCSCGKAKLTEQLE
ncbi:MBL fold metallo-hydrolase [Pseudomonas gingeri]|uniref:MBL fold metallo-hydrolase n=1 Tax=Pseudomonas gingeri TaxID=117681 RepID=UPI0015A45799|nr:MBL fold metallo-hydrolase [Pseudomonas gingeri]NWA28744.1 MBL fold metallo-hydrolase [Pseudomonas gingeri]